MTELSVIAQRNPPCHECVTPQDRVSNYRKRFHRTAIAAFATTLTLEYVGWSFFYKLRNKKIVLFKNAILCLPQLSRLNLHMISVLYVFTALAL
jgi:hypothetical protein